MTTLERLRKTCDPFAGEIAKIRTIRGGKVLVVHFDDYATMCNFFERHLLFADDMKGHSSKAIGTTLYVWNR